MSYTYMEELSNEALVRYKAKLDILGLEKCPYKFAADTWKDDPTEWPSLIYHNLYHYLIKTPRVYTPEAMENYKSLEAHKFFISGWVQTLYHIKQNNVTIIKCQVRPSYRANDDPHNPWLAINERGNVLAGHCDCMAGLGETCSHVAATLYEIEAAVRVGLTKCTPTDLPCEWNQNFTKNVMAALISDVQFYSNEAKEKISRKRQKEQTSFTSEEKLKILKSLPIT